VYMTLSEWAFEIKYLNIMCVEHSIEFHKSPQRSPRDASPYNCDSHLLEPPKLHFISIDHDVRIVKLTLAITDP
jgi:hypothetical protein